MQLYETHIPVVDPAAAAEFYRDVVGLPMAYRDPTRDITFLWVDEKERGMLGLWGPNTAYGPKEGPPRKCHFAFSVSFEQLLAAINKLEGRGIVTTGFGGNPTREPTVIGWMPSAQIYFRDLDGHSLEFIALLPEEPDPDFIGPYSEWKRRLAGR